MSVRAPALALAASIRPANNRASLVAFVGAGLILGAPGVQLAIGGVLIVAAYGVAVILNDLSDQAVDRANANLTPLVSGTVTPGQAWAMLGCCAAAVGASQAWLRQPVGVEFSVTYLALAVGYSLPGLAIEDRGLLATALLATCYCVLPLWFAAGLAPADPDHFEALLAVAGLLGAGGLLYKDFRDRTGDALHGKRTPLVRYGATAVVVASFVLSAGGGLTLVALSPHPLVSGLLVLVAWCVLVRVALRRGANPWAVQLYYLLCAGALLSGLE
ncbi:MAG: UbiA family prenyltransferase [Acidimicrobiales bacterium]